MTDPIDDLGKAALLDRLDKANEAIRLLEQQLQGQTLSRDHPRWTATGELVLAGDVGHNGNGVEFCVVTINGLTGTIFAIDPALRSWSPSDVTMSRKFSDCQHLVARRPLPRPRDPEDGEG